MWEPRPDGIQITRQLAWFPFQSRTEPTKELYVFGPVPRFARSRDIHTWQVALPSFPAHGVDVPPHQSRSLFSVD